MPPPVPPAVPPTGQCYVGQTIRTWDAPDPQRGDTRPFAVRFADSVATETAGKMPAIVGIPTIWQHDDGVTMEPFSIVLGQIQQIQALSPQTIPFVTWNAQTGWWNTNPAYTGITTQTINTGSLDAYITSYADAIKAYKKPLFIRPISGEINGNWSHNASPLANPTLTIQDFLLAWQRVVTIFKNRQAKNVAWVWNAVTYPEPPIDWGIDPNIAAYYPGDTFVQWVGCDHYDDGPPSFLDPHVALAVAHNKPFFLAEWGVRLVGSILTPPDQATWLAQMFDYVEAHPTIKALVYFNYNMNEAGQDLTGHTYLYNGTVNYAPNVNNSDCRLLAESGAAWRSTYASRIAATRYLGA